VLEEVGSSIESWRGTGQAHFLDTVEDVLDESLAVFENPV
jgi:hypothetical protein